MKKKILYVITMLFAFLPIISVNAYEKVSCGGIKQIPKKFPEMTNSIMVIIQIAVPVLLVVMGSIDLVKGVTAGKEDEIKKGQQLFIKRLITGVLIFFIIVVVKFLISLINDATNSENIVDCIDCFLTDVEKCKKE